MFNASSFAVLYRTLSEREREVLRLATDGRTDEQIAQRLGLSVSTVNSYWVRIRGKLGQYSRTDLVARLVRLGMEERTAELQAENLRLRESLDAALLRLEELRAERTALREDRWSLLALARLPEAVLVVEPPGVVAFANRRACRLYAARPGELERVALADLTMEGAPLPCVALFCADGPESEVVGVDEAYYARRRDGSSFRAVLRAERFESADGPRVATSVREFLGDALEALQALRRVPSRTQATLG